MLRPTKRIRLRRLFFTDDLWVPAPGGGASDALIAAMRSVRRGLLLELGGLTAVFALMETLRYLPT